MQQEIRNDRKKKREEEKKKVKKEIEGKMEDNDPQKRREHLLCGPRS